MYAIHRPTLIALLAVLGLSACEKAQIIRQDLKPTSQNAPQSTGENPPPAAGDSTPPIQVGAELKFASVFEAVFKENCFMCHGKPGPDGTPKIKGGVDLTSADTLLNPKSGKHVVTAGNSDSSLLFTAVRDGDMPPRGELTADQVAMIKAYIDQGAAQ